MPLQEQASLTLTISSLQSGEKVTNLDELQDIDELHVVEVRGRRFVHLQMPAFH